MKKKRACLWALGILLVLVFLCSSWYISKSSKLNLASARELLYQDGYLYGVVTCNMEATLFRVDVEEGTYDSIFLDYWVGNERNYIFNGMTAPDGTVYFIRERWYTDSDEISDDLIRCDFDSGAVTELFNTDNPEFGRLVQASAIEQGFLLSYQKAVAHGYEIRRFLVSEQGELLEEWPSFEVSSTYSNLYNRDREHLFYIEADGSVYAGGTNGIFPCIFANDGTVISRHNAIFCMMQDGVLFYNLEHDDPYLVDYKTGTVTKDEHSWLETHRENFYTIYSMTDMGDGNAAVGILTDDYGAIPGVVNNGLLTAVPDAVAPLSRQLTKSLAITALIMAAIILSVGIYRLILHRFGGIFPTSLKIICVVIPLLAASFWLVRCEARKIFTERYLEQESSKLYYEATAVAKSINTRLMEQADSYTAELKSEIGQAISRIGEYRKVRNLDATSEVSISNLDMIYDVYKFQTGEFYSLTGDQLSCEPASWLNLGQELKNLDICADMKQEVFSVYQSDRRDAVLGIYVPILSDSREVLGAVSGQSSGKEMEAEVERQVNAVSRSVLIFLVGILGILTIVEYRSLRPLEELRKAVMEMERGEMAVRLRIRGDNEIGAILQIFNRMFHNTERHVKQVEALKQAYEPFVPNSLIALLGKEDIRFVNPGDEAEFEAVILNIDANLMEELTPVTRAHELFDFMNQALYKIVPVMEAHGGIISRFTNTGVEVFFPGKPDPALCAAAESMKELQNGPQYLNRRRIEFSAGICLGKIRLGIWGTQNRMSATVMSSSGHLAVTLQQTAGLYHAGILVSGTVADQIADFENRFGNRFFCCLPKEMGSEEERIIEVYEVQEPEQARLKEYTKKSFESGLDFAAKSQWKEARKAFIAVLKMNQNDRVAQKYFRLCDEENFQPDSLIGE